MHSSIEHLFALIDAAVAAAFRSPYMLSRRSRHAAALRDDATCERLEEKLAAVGRAGSVASVTGRYYAMDRDSRWERTERAYDCSRAARADRGNDALAAAVDAGYARGEDDEFVAADDRRHAATGRGRRRLHLLQLSTRPRAPAHDRLQCRTSRVLHDRSARSRRKRTTIHFRDHDEVRRNVYAIPVLFGPRPQYDTFGEMLARAGLRQLRLAETEKYAHVRISLTAAARNNSAARTAS